MLAGGGPPLRFGLLREGRGGGPKGNVLLPQSPWRIACPRTVRRAVTDAERRALRPDVPYLGLHLAGDHLPAGSSGAGSFGRLSIRVGVRPPCRVRVAASVADAL